MGTKTGADLFQHEFSDGAILLPGSVTNPEAPMVVLAICDGQFCIVPLNNPDETDATCVDEFALEWMVTNLESGIARWSDDRGCYEFTEE